MLHSNGYSYRLKTTAFLMALGMVDMIVSTSTSDARSTSKRSVGSLGGGDLKAKRMATGCVQTSSSLGAVEETNPMLRHDNKQDGCTLLLQLVQFAANRSHELKQAVANTSRKQSCMQYPLY